MKYCSTLSIDTLSAKTFYDLIFFADDYFCTTECLLLTDSHASISEGSSLYYSATISKPLGSNLFKEITKREEAFRKCWPAF